MKVVYLETSALLQWLLGEAGADEVAGAIDGAEVVLTSTLTRAEAERALVRAEAQTSIRGGDARRLRGLLSRAEASWVRMAMTDGILARAGSPFPVEPVRTLDAIHLATALELTAAFADLRVLSSDRRIRDNAEALGLL